MIPRSCLVVVAAAATLGLTTAAASPDDKVATGVTYGFFDGGSGGSNRRDDATTSAATSSSTTITTVVEERMITSRVAASEPSSNCIGFGCSEEPSNSHDEAQSQSLQPNLAGSCTPVELELTTDGRPQDISFELVCNDYTVWTYPSALIPYEGPHGELVVNACVFLHNKCCHFALHDSHGDGLEEGDYAYVALKVSDETVLHYDSMTNPPFTTLAHSFGDSCSSSSSASPAASSASSHHHSSTASTSTAINVTPKDIPQDVECEMGLSRPLNFRITLDEHPEDLSWFLVCSTEDSDGDEQHEMVTVWDQPRGSLAGHVGQVAAEKACIPYRSTCTFSIIDSQGDGLTSMDGSDSGGYTLTLGVSLIDAFVNEPFSEKSYCIGRKCNPTTDNLEEQKEEFQKELEQLEQEQQQEQEMLEKLKESSETTQEEIDQLEKLEQSLEEQEELEQQQPSKHKPPASDDQVVVPSSTQEEEDLILLTEQEQEALTSLEEEEESFQSWLIAGLGIVGFLLILVVCTGYYMHRRIKSRRRDSGSSMSASLREAREALTMGRRSSSAKEVVSEMVVKQANANRGHGDLTTITDSEDTEDESTDDDGMFVLDA